MVELMVWLFLVHPHPTGCWSRRRGTLHMGVGLQARACSNMQTELHKKKSEHHK